MNCAERCRSEIINQFIEELDDQVEMAVKTAIKSENPVDGYRNAIERMEEAFDGVESSYIVGSIKDMLLRILNVRVGVLMRKAEDKDKEKLEKNRSETCDGCCECCEGFC